MNDNLHEPTPAMLEADERDSLSPLHLRRERLVSCERLDEVATRGYLRVWYRWERLLLAEGGQLVMHPDHPEDRAADLLERSRIVPGRHVQRVSDPRLPVDGPVERVAAELWLAGSTADGEYDIADICYGYALHKDAVWRQHVWVATTEGRILEIGEPALAYAGMTLDWTDSLILAALYTS